MKAPAARTDAAWMLPASIEVDIKRQCLVYRDSPSDERTEVLAPPNLLDDFIGLVRDEANGTFEDRVASFASAWGPLRLCGHGLPRTHVDEQTWFDLLDDLDPDAVPCSRPRFRLPADRGREREPLDAWRRYSTAARQIVFISMVLKGEVRGRADLVTKDEWQPVSPLTRGVVPDGATPLPVTGDGSGVALVSTPSDPVARKEQQRRDRQAEAERADAAERAIAAEVNARRRQRGALALVVDEWLHLAGIKVAMSWDTGGKRTGPSLEVGVNSLFGALGMQLVMVVTGKSSLYFCGHCLEVFEAGKALRVGDPRFCPNCSRAWEAERKRVRRRLEREERQRVAMSDPPEDADPPGTKAAAR